MTVFPGAVDTFSAKKVIDLEDAIQAIEAYVLDIHSITTPARHAATDAQQALVGNGASKPLSGFYGTLAAAQAAYPHATALTNELDWAAAQAAANSGARSVAYNGHYITNREIVPAANQEHYGTGPSTVIENIASRTTDAYNASPFQLGNMHPIILNEAQTGYAWAVYGLNAIAAGDTTVTVSVPGGVTRAPAAGEIVVIRSNNPPVTAGIGSSYDFMMWNRVLSWNSGTGALVLELPVPMSILATGTSTQLFGPKLCLNANSDLATLRAWWIARGVTIRDLKLIGLAPCGVRTGAWRCNLRNLEIDADHLISANAFALCELSNIKGYFAERFIEAKQVCQDTKFRSCHGTYRKSAAVPKPAISIGEQCYGLDLDVTVDIGSDFTESQRALEVWAPDIKVKARIDHNGSGAHTEAWTVKSTSHLARPPEDIDLDLTVNSRIGLPQYGVIGNDANLDALVNDGDPRRVRWRLHQMSEGAAGYSTRIQRGTELKAEVISGNAFQSWLVSPGEAPEGARVLLTTLAGATYAAGSETEAVGSSFTMLGPKVGDEIRCGLQLVGSVTAGALGSLLATGAINGVGQVTVYIRNRSAVAVTTSGAPALWLWGTWSRMRV
ncbi:MAG: hypothetical protein LC798_03060 [Chloroflexi bacterium]|nr:hypothetical protein [Chloroflexota bacterium]